MSDELIVIAQIAGAHGVRGDMKVRSYTDSVEDCFAYGPLLNEDGEILVTPKKVTHQKDALFIVWPEEQRTREEWESLKGVMLHVPRKSLPEPDEEEFYISDLIGCRIMHVDGRDLGTVRYVHNFGADDLLEINAPRGDGYMLPFTRDSVPTVDLDERVLCADVEDEMLPETLHASSEKKSGSVDGTSPVDGTDPHA